MQSHGIGNTSETIRSWFMHLLMVAWGTDAWPHKKAWSKLINNAMYFIVLLTQCPSRMQNIDGGITVFIILP